MANNTEKPPVRRTLTFTIEYDEASTSAIDQATQIINVVVKSIIKYNESYGAPGQRPSNFYSKANMTGIWLEPLEVDIEEQNALLNDVRNITK